MYSLCVRIRGDRAIALLLIRHEDRQQRGMPSIALQCETFGQSHFKTVVGIFAKLVSRIADER